MRDIEDWEFFGRVELHAPLMIMVKQRSQGISDEAETARAAALFADALRTIEARLSDREWLSHTRMTAADVTCGAVVHRVREMGAFDLPEDCPATYAWTDRVMAYDRAPDA